MELSAQDICELVKTAAERMIFVDLPSSKTGVKIRADKVSTHSRPKAAGHANIAHQLGQCVSTHSRPKAAGFCTFFVI